LTPPLIYNLFPRLVGPTTAWVEHTARAREMAFNWIYLNPWHYPGFSGSLYAPKELWRLNPLFLPEGADELSLQPLTDYLAESSRLGVPVMMDLVVNHTSKDSPLIAEHPEWFVRDERGEVVSPFAVDPDDPTRKTVWGDLAEVDNAGTPDREGLWAFWSQLVRRSLEMGFAGFRCDAAYMVPAELWKHLIATARAVNPDARFFAETLGAPEEAIEELHDAGFDFIFNSSKWWDFREPWALEQHERFREMAPSISFPETHDTARLAEESGGSEAVQRQRYAFSAAFSAGLMMPIGYEFGFRRQVDVVETRPSDWERGGWDLTAFVTRVNRLKLGSSVLHGEGEMHSELPLDHDVLVLRRSGQNGATGWLLLNKREGEETSLGRPAGAEALRLHRVCRDDAPESGEAVPESVTLAPAEVVYLLPAEAA
jgi:starch synthase (maltosyl-transferring)